MIYMEPRHLAIVKHILAKYPYTFYAYGSHAKGTHRRLSDLDLCVMEDLPLRELDHIEEDFEESDLPFKVELICWQKISKEFQNTIKPDLVRIN